MSLPACPLITFYSYKGGVGRSQTLANVAVALANRGKNVIMVDFDLESPGLHRYFSPLEHPEKRLGEEELNQKGGLLDWLSKAKTVPADEPFITEHLIDCTSHALRPGRGWLKLIACGAQIEIGGRGYSGRVRDFNWRQFEEEAYGQDYLELMRRQLQGVEGANYILLDSRTGVTDVGMLCTFVLPDVVVMLFALHDQGISGVRWLAGRLKEHQEKMKAEANSEFSYPQKILLVPTRVEETQELDLRDHWIQRARAALAGEGHVWLGEYGQRLPYLPKAAFGENIVVSETAEENALSHSLKGLAEHLEKACFPETRATTNQFEPPDGETLELDVLQHWRAGLHKRLELLQERLHRLGPLHDGRNLKGYYEEVQAHHQSYLEIYQELLKLTRAQRRFSELLTQVPVQDVSTLEAEEGSVLRALHLLRQVEQQQSQAHTLIRELEQEAFQHLEAVLHDEPSKVQEELERLRPHLLRGALKTYQETYRARADILRLNRREYVSRTGEEEQVRRRVLALKRQVDELINQLELQEPLLSDALFSEALLEELSHIRVRASEALRRRDTALLIALEAGLRRSLHQPEALLRLRELDPTSAS
ncbi:MAG: KGGVGR-motif variant AAA ATPase [Myxococcota bacterium]